MRISTAAFLLLAASPAAGFAPGINTSRSASTSIRSSPSDGSGSGDTAPPQKKKVLTEADVLAKAKSLGTIPGSNPNGDPAGPGGEETPKLFAPQIYDDFQSSLLTLDKRAKSGPGSLSAGEVDKFEEEASRIIGEMKEFMADPKGTEKKIRMGYEAAAGGAGLDVKSSEVAKEEPPKPTVVEVAAPAATVAPPAPEPVAAVAEAPNAQLVPDWRDDKEPDKDWIGFGLAQGTTNTYAIPGMDEMSPEEYREALQKTVSARQALRRKAAIASGSIGNKNSNGYLDALSPKGDGGPALKKTSWKQSSEVAKEGESGQ